MAVDLIQLISKFISNEDVETERAFFRTKVPEVAPEAYLHTIHKAAPPELVREVSEELKLPRSVIDFYRHWNGAHLFHALAIFGCVAHGQLLNRSDRFSLPPFDIRQVNRERKSILAGRNLVIIASYRYDGSQVCVERDAGGVVCFVERNTTKERMRWGSIDDWLTQEIERISFLFDERGRRLVAEEKLLPGIESRPS